jgi:ABC-type transporter Mla MlaB component
MRSEALDITIESRGSSVWIVLAGPFHNEQVPNITEKITGLIDDGNKLIVIDMENITEVDDGVVPMYLRLLNLTKGKRGELKLIFKNPVVTTAFAPYRSIFTIHPDEKSLEFNTILHSIRRRGILLSRKTGVRLSPPVAVFIFLVLAGWFLTLTLFLSTQNTRIHAQEREILELTGWKKAASAEMHNLRERFRPFEQLGLVPDSLPSP